MSRHARSHPPTLLTLARRALETECGPTKGARIVAAVSGGRDSMALLHVLAKLRAPLGFELFAHGVDHGLRDAARAELERAAAFARELHVPFAVTTLDRLGRGGNLQERARLARYEILDAVAAEKDALLATAHHADDRAETVLLRLLRGASAAGLGVLPARTGRRIRPFVRAPRHAVDLHVARHEVPFSDDPSNVDPRFLRTRVRHDVMPLLRELDAGIVEHLCGVADDVVALTPTVTASASAWGTLPRATRDALAAAERTRDTRARILLPGGRVARYEKDPARAVGAEPRGRIVVEHTSSRLRGSKSRDS
jgi:tRNA(Ile)-lysidine synthase